MHRPRTYRPLSLPILAWFSKDVLGREPFSQCDSVASVQFRVEACHWHPRPGVPESVRSLVAGQAQHLATCSPAFLDCASVMCLWAGRSLMRSFVFFLVTSGSSLYVVRTVVSWFFSPRWIWAARSHTCLITLLFTIPWNARNGPSCMRSFRAQHASPCR